MAKNQALRNRIARNIKKYRIENELRQDELGEKLGVGKSTVSIWEGATSMPDIDTLYAMCEMWGITLDDICSPGITVDYSAFTEKKIKIEKDDRDEFERMAKRIALYFKALDFIANTVFTRLKSHFVDNISWIIRFYSGLLCTYMDL